MFWKSNDISLKKAIEYESKPSFKVVDNFISDKHVKCFIEYEDNPKKIITLITNIVVYDLETFNKIRAVPFCVCI